ncbi:3-hydroxybutyryl-CoA dehydrogenase [Kibdelosporangium aridum]|uniref:3-hydroxybutyryl-CoA dehydrogenase n=1 Tax=Kibdelosporangium aridum TaxID=2030 RepID=UPI0005250521
MQQIERVGVVGCGIMGSGISEVCARAGLSVRVAVSSKMSWEAGRQRIQQSLDRAVGKGKITGLERDGAVRRIEFTNRLADLADRELVIEAIREDEPDKLDLLAKLDRNLAADAIVASNTSTIPIGRLAGVTGRPDRVIGLHFFSPVPVLPLVELVLTARTDDSVAARAEQFVTMKLGKKLIRSPDRAGFVVNALLVPYLLSAIRMVESGFATAEVVDKGMVFGCSHPMGPLALTDLIGLDTVVAMADSLYGEFRDPWYAPPVLLRRMVEAGWLGRKTGQGFHTYPVRDAGGRIRLNRRA